MEHSIENCLFCKIASGNIPAKIVYEDDHVVAFDDINPHAPTHKVIIPRKHISTLNDAEHADAELLGRMIQAATHIAKELNIADDGYRVVMNCNAGGGQTVYHIHLHLFGGRGLSWPPG